MRGGNNGDSASFCVSLGGAESFGNHQKLRANIKFGSCGGKTFLQAIVESFPVGVGWMSVDKPSCDNDFRAVDRLLINVDAVGIQVGVDRRGVSQHADTDC